MNHIANLISRLNTGEKNIKIGKIKALLPILDNLQLKGFINFFYNPYSKLILIYNNNINYITLISKPGRRVYTKETPYKLGLGSFIINNKELILYVE
jgi:ribosomal protein S8